MFKTNVATIPHCEHQWEPWKQLHVFPWLSLLLNRLAYVLYSDNPTVKIQTIKQSHWKTVTSDFWYLHNVHYFILNCFSPMTMFLDRLDLDHKTVPSSWCLVAIFCRSVIFACLIWCCKQWKTGCKEHISLNC